MAGIVLRVRLTSGDHLDVAYEEPDVDDEHAVIEHALAALAEHDGLLRCRHGERLVVLYAVESPPSRWRRAARSSRHAAVAARVPVLRHPGPITMARNACCHRCVQWACHG